MQFTTLHYIMYIATVGKKDRSDAMCPIYSANQRIISEQRFLLVVLRLLNCIMLLIEMV